MASSALCDRRIFVVEDEYLIAMMLCDALESVGSVVVGPVPSVEKALKTIAADLNIDAAILDVNLGGAMAYPVAEALMTSQHPVRLHVWLRSRHSSCSLSEDQELS